MRMGEKNAGMLIMTKDASGRSVVPISGALNFVTVPTVNKNSRILIKQNPKIIFDLSQVTSSDNTGVALLAALASYAKALQQELTFINLPQQLLALVAASGLKEILPIS